MENKAVLTHEFLSHLVGRRWFKACSVLATWFFYFCDAPSGKYEYEGASCDYLDVECPWRITKGNLIITGLDDHSVEGNAKEFQTWNPDMPRGFQHQKLQELLGERKKASVYNAGSRFVVESVEADQHGGFRIMLTDGCALEVFPASGIQMQWALHTPDGGVVLKDGKLEAFERPAAKSL